MNDPHLILGIDANATPAQIQDAYNLKRAELISQEEQDPTTAEKIQQLDDAYQQLISHSQIAIATTSSYQAPIDPVLGVVNKLVIPIQVESEDVAYHPCPHCNALNPLQATVCATCGKQISRPCPNCGKLVFLGVAVCPRCNTMIREHDQQRLAEAVITKRRVDDERLEDHVRVEAEEQAHRKRARFGCVLWTVIILAIIVLIYVANYAINNYGAQ